MGKECVVAVYPKVEAAQQAVHSLKEAGFPVEQVSLVTKGSTADAKEIAALETGGDSVRDAAIGAGLGAVVGVLSGIAALATGGVGAIFLAGPIATGLSGATAGAFLGGMAGWGVHRDRIGHYEKLVHDGHVVLVAHGDPQQLAHADRLLRDTSPEEQHLYATSTDEEVPG